MTSYFVVYVKAVESWTVVECEHYLEAILNRLEMLLYCDRHMKMTTKRMKELDMNAIVVWDDLEI